MNPGKWEATNWGKYSIEKIQAYNIQSVQIKPQKVLEGTKEKHIFKTGRAKIRSSTTALGIVQTQFMEYLYFRVSYHSIELFFKDKEN